MPIISGGGGGGGGTPFNGGTITTPLVINTPAQAGLQLKGTGGFVDAELDNDGGGFFFDTSGVFGWQWTANGNGSLTLDAVTSARFRILRDNGGAQTLLFTADAADNSLTCNAPKIGFYASPPIAQQTGVPVTAAAIHAALVALGLITA